jgi:hypothetical protein
VLDVEKERLAQAVEIRTILEGSRRREEEWGYVERINGT